MSQDLEPIAGEVVDEIERLPAIRQTQEVSLFQTSDPVEIVEKATRVADVLSDVLRKKKLVKKIGKGEHVLVEGWTLLGSMLGVFPVCVWTKPVGTRGWEARVEARTRDGSIVGAAEAECLRDERRWKTADDFAVRSMAQTRATSKALRQPLGFVVSLAGFSATPAEEMQRDLDEAANPYPSGEPERKESASFPLPGSWPKVEEAIEPYGETIRLAFGVFVGQAAELLFGGPLSSLDREQKGELRKTSARAAQSLRDSIDVGEVPGPLRADLREAWRVALERDDELEGPEWRLDASEDDRPERAES